MEKNKIVKVFSLICLSFVVSFAMLACRKDNGKTNDVTTPTQEVEKMETSATYYSSDNNGLEFTNVENKFTLSLSGVLYSGTIVKNGEELSFEFDKDSLNATAVLSDDKILFKIDNDEYTLLKKVNYTVQFDTNGGPSVAAETVLNGKTATRPTNPIKDGQVFVGWYTSASYTDLFDFNEAVTADKTLYARFVPATSTGDEYSVLLVNGEIEIRANTLGGALFDLPTPSGEGDFAGWWVSANGDSNTLSYKYEEGMQLTKDTTLYAVFANGNPLVSLSNTKIEWTGIGLNVVYTVEVKDGNGETVYTQSTQSTSVDFNFDNLAGDIYEVTVTGNLKTGTATYVNKQIANITDYKIEDEVLYFEGVENATSYAIKVECGNHEDETIELGNSYLYDFSTCTMKDGGIVFTLYAKADGYLTSETTITYNKELTPITGLSYDKENGYLTWNPVFGAQYYVLEVSYEVEGEEGSTETKTDKYYVNDLYFDLRDYSGNISVSVYPKTPGYNSPKAIEFSYSKQLLATPTDLVITRKDADKEGYVEGSLGYISWDKVSGATGYIVDINGTKYETATNELAFSPSMIKYKVDQYDIKVQAVTKEEENTVNYSLFTDTISAFTYWTGNVWYENGGVYWDYFLGVEYYAVKINSNSIIWKVTSNHSFSRYWPGGAECYKDGFNKIEVTYYEGSTIKSTCYSTIDVYMNRVYYMTNPVDKPASSAVYAEGDVVNLYAPTKPGYSLEGWYSIPDGIKSGGNKCEYLSMPGQNVILYADWTPNEYTITLDADEDFGTCEKEAENVVYNTSYQLPIPQSKVGTCTFAGWYSLPNGQGIRYTDEKGLSLENYNLTSDTTVHAYYPAILDYKIVKNKAGEDAYEVKAGNGIAYVTEITIPATYTNPVDNVTLPVCSVGSFKESKTLVKINIPDTIESIDYILGFDSCTSLDKVNIYKVSDENYEVLYTSQDGILYYNNSVNEVSGWQLVFVPYDHQDIIHIMTGTVSIIAPSEGWRTSIVHIPYTVREIQAGTFQSSTLIKEIVFEPTPEKDSEGNDITPVGLTIGANAFKGCTGLKSITLPKRLEQIDTSLFDSCSGLKAINIEEGAANYASVNGVISDAKKSKLIYAPKGIDEKYEIAQGVIEISEGAFYGCTKLTELVVPSWVSNIGLEAFRGCTSLATIEFQGTEDDPSLTISERAFYGLTSLESVTLSENVRIVKANAFGGITKLKEVTVLATGEINYDINICSSYSTTASASAYAYVEVVNIGPLVPEFDIIGSFGGTNDKLSLINIDEANKSFKTVDSVLYNSDLTTIIFFPKTYEGDFILPSTITRIAGGAFQKRLNIKSITINKNVTAIGDFAFNDCRNLSSVTFEAGGTEELTIGKNAFYYCKSLTNIELPVRTVSIGEYAFSNISNISSFTIPEGVTSIGARAFYYDSSLSSITIPKTVTTLGDFNGDTVTKVDIFEKCDSLTKIVVTEGNQLFASFDGMLYSTGTSGKAEKLIYCPPGKAGKVEVPSTVNEISENAFYYNKLITSFGFVDNKSAISYAEDGKEVQGVLKVGAHAFDHCTSLKTCSLPNIEYIPEYLFYYCTELESFTIPNTVKAIGYLYHDDQKNADVLLSARNAFNYSVKELIFEEGNTTNTLEIPDSVYPTRKESGGKVTVTYTESYSASAFHYSNISTISLPERTTTIGNYAFYRYSNNSTLTSVSFPKTLTFIGDYAFHKNTGISSISFPEGSQLTTIGRDAFAYCEGLKTVSLPKEVTSIGKYNSTYNTSKTEGYTFAYCSNLESINIPDGVKELPQYLFYTCTSLNTVSFGENSQIETLGDYLFRKSGLKTITIPKTVETIKQYAFKECEELTSITFAEDSNLYLIGKYAFSDTAVESFTFPTYYELNASNEKVVKTGTYGTNMFDGCTKLTTVNFSASVGSIPTGTFNGCESLSIITVDSENKTLAVDSTNGYVMSKDESIIYLAFGFPEDGRLVLPSTVKTISAYSFQNNSGLKYVYIPNSVTKIGPYAFSGCSVLEEVEFQDGEASGNNAGVTKMNSTSISAVGTMGYHVFDNCPELTTVKLPALLKQIPQYTFKDCTKLKNVIFPTYAPATYTSTNTGVQVGQYAFQNCGFETLDLPENITEIGSYAFSKNANLTTLTINSKAYNGAYTTSGVSAGAISGTSNSTTIVKGWNTDAFADCGKLTSVEFKGTALDSKYLGNNMFKNDYNLKTVNLPTKLETTCSASFQNCSSLSSISLPDTLKYLYNSTFDGCAKITEITIPSNVVKIGAYALRRTGISSISLPESCVTLGGSAFAGTKISTATISKGISYGTGVYSNCTELTNIIIEDGVTIIPTSTFDGCIRLKEINIPASVLALGTPSNSSVSSMVFQNCTNLDKVTFAEGSSLLAIGSNAFKNCAKLTTIDLPKTLAYIGDYAFSNSGLTEVTIPANVIFTGAYVFVKCPSLEKVVFEENEEHNLNFVSKYMFYDCSNLKEVLIPEYFTTIAEYAFSGCSSLEGITIPSSVELICNRAFESSGLVSITIPSSVKNLGGTFDLDVSINTSQVSVTVEPDASLSSSSAYIFTDCEKLTNVVIEEGLAELPYFCFKNDIALESITIPSTLTKFNNYAFNGCISLKTLNAPSVKEYGLNVFSGCESLETYVLGDETVSLGTSCFAESGLKSINIPKKINTIPSKCFLDCTSLETVTVSSPDFYEIGISAFDGCTSLKTFNIPESTLEIGDYAFRNCTLLSSITLPKDLREIGDFVFQSSTITAIEIPAKLETIGLNPFAGCNELASISISSDNAFFAVKDNTILTADGTIIAVLSSYEGVYTIPDGTSISAGSFAGCGKITKVVLSNNITEIPEYTFAYMSNLESIETRSEITEIGKYAFAYSPKLTSFDLSNVDTLATYAFAYSGLKNVVIPESISSLPSYAFTNSALETISFEGNISIGSYAFNYCESLKEFTMTDKITSFSSYPFKYSGLTKINVLPGITYGSGLLAYCENLEEVTIEEGVTSLPSYAFEYSGPLTKIIWPSTLTKLNSYAFRNSYIDTMEIPTTITELPTYMFANSTIKSIVLPENIVKIPSHCFDGCTLLESVEFKAEALSNSSFCASYAFADCTSLKSIYFPVFGPIATCSSYMFDNWTADQTIYLACSDSAFTSSQISYLTDPKYIGEAKVVFNYDPNEQIERTEKETLTDSEGKLYITERTYTGKAVKSVKYYSVDLESCTIAAIEVSLYADSNRTTFIEVVDGTVKYAEFNGTVADLSLLSFDEETNTYTYYGDSTINFTIEDGVLVIQK